MTVKQFKKSDERYKKFFIYDSDKKKIGILFIDIKIKYVKENNGNKVKSEMN